MVSGPYNIRDFQKKMIPEHRRSNPRHNQQLAVCGHMGMYYEGKKKDKEIVESRHFHSNSFISNLKKLLCCFLNL